MLTHGTKAAWRTLCLRLGWMIWRAGTRPKASSSRVVSIAKETHYGQESANPAAVLARIKAAAVGRFGSTRGLVHLVDMQAGVRGAQLGQGASEDPSMYVLERGSTTSPMSKNDVYDVCSFIIMCSFLFGDDL